MKKKLLCLMMALLMLSMPLLMTSCGNQTEEVVDNSERPELTLTFYTIKDENTTEAGIAHVQSELNALLFNRYKTRIELKCFTEAEYQTKMEALQTEIETVKEAEGEDVEESAAPQLDIFYLPDEKAYTDAAVAGRLLPLDSYLKVDFKEFYDYLPQNLLANATLAFDEGDASLYGLPNNTLVAGEGWYYVINQELADKYAFEEITGKRLEEYISKKNAPQLEVLAEYAAVIKENEEGVIPVANPAPANNVDFYGDIAGFPIAVSNSEYGPFESRGVLQTYAANSSLRKHFELMASFREAGYFVDRPLTAEDNFFMDIRQGSVEDVQAWKDAGYTVMIYRRPVTELALCRNGFYAISAYCNEDYRARAMEVLQMLYTNEDVHNLFAFGVEGVHYEVTLRDENEKPLLIKRTVADENNVYVTDFYKSGNTLIGLIPEELGLDYAKNVQELNRGARLSGFASFHLAMDEDEQEWFDEFTALEAEYTAAYEKLCNGTADWEAICDSFADKFDESDLTGFIDEIFSERYRAAAKKVRDADKANYSTSPVYLQSEYDAMVEGGLITEDGETPEDAPAAETPAA